MALDNNLFDKVEKRTKVSKDTIISLAKKLQSNKDEGTIREVIDTLCSITNKKLPEDSVQRIVKTIVDDKVPKGIDKMF